MTFLAGNQIRAFGCTEITFFELMAIWIFAQRDTKSLDYLIFFVDIHFVIRFIYNYSVDLPAGQKVFASAQLFAALFCLIFPFFIYKLIGSASSQQKKHQHPSGDPISTSHHLCLDDDRHAFAYCIPQSLH